MFSRRFALLLRFLLEFEANLIRFSFLEVFLVELDDLFSILRNVVDSNLRHYVRIVFEVLEAFCPISD